jgi:hypothetical protein
MLLGAGTSTGVLAGFLRERGLFEKPNTTGNLILCGIAIAVSFAGIAAFFYGYNKQVWAGFLFGALFLLSTLWPDRNLK